MYRCRPRLGPASRGRRQIGKSTGGAEKLDELHAKLHSEAKGAKTGKTEECLADAVAVAADPVAWLTVRATSTPQCPFCVCNHRFFPGQYSEYPSAYLRWRLNVKMAELCFPNSGSFVAEPTWIGSVPDEFAVAGVGRKDMSPFDNTTSLERVASAFVTRKYAALGNKSICSLFGS